MEIKQIDNSNLTELIQLVTDVFMEFEAPDYSDEGIATFFDTALNDQDFMRSLACYGAYINNKLVVVIATGNNGNHITLFFVDTSYHRQGIGRKLFETVLQNASSNEITVNSSPYAKDVYRHLGFEATDTEQNVTGIRFIPMMYKS